jgi:subtilase family serine protease
MIGFHRPRLIATAAAVAGVLLAACGSAAGPTSTTMTTSARQSAGGTADCDSVATCYTPRQLEVAYGIWPLLKRGIDGRGETVVMPELAERRLSPPQVSDLRQDLAGFDRAFRLPAAQLRVTTRFAPGVSPWLSYAEETLDVEMVHAVAPDAAIRVVLFTPSALATPAGLTAALIDTIRLGTSHGDVVSITAGAGEHCFTRAEVAVLHAALRAAARQHATVVGASQDTGPVGAPCDIVEGLTGNGPAPVRELSLPASDPLVLAVGGTRLTASHRTGAYRGETAWGLPYGTPGTNFQASGGGFSHLFARPEYQDGIPGPGATRGVPDVAADASGHTGMVLLISEGGGHYFIRNSGGTSASAPFWAGLIAVADQYAGHHLGFVNPGLYQIARSPVYHRAFHDITTGNNTVVFPPKTFPGYRATAGWDPVTGLGSPDAQILIPLLAACADEPGGVAGS